jgi:flagellar hook-basal body complex protein FliE
MVVAMATYIVFHDIDGSYWVLKVLQRINRISAEEIVGVVSYCVPRAMCAKLLNKVVKVLAVDLDYYIYMYIPFRRYEIVVVSGGLSPKQGYLVFLKGLRPQDIVTRLSRDGQEIVFRDLYYSVLASISEYEKSCKDTLKQVMESLRDAVKASKELAQNVARYTSETLGFVAKPEAMMAAEAAMTVAKQIQEMAARAAAPTPPAQQVPSKPSLIERLKGLFSFWFRKPKEKVISPE